MAEIVGRTPRRIQQLVKDGMPPPVDGNYEMEACIQWIIQFLQEKAGGGSANLNGRERLARAKAEREEFALARERRELVTVAEWEQAMADMVTPARRELLSLEAKLRSEIGPEAAGVVGGEIKRCLRSLGGADV